MGRDTIVRRIQSTNPALNLPTETIREVGNSNTVAIIRDTPDLTFDVDSLDATTDFEALLTRVDPATTVDGDVFDLADAKPIDIKSAYKPTGSTIASKGVILPYLYLESAAYRFAVGQNATQRFTMRGDSIFFTPEAPQYQRIGPTASAGPHAFDVAGAALYEDGDDDVYALCVTAFYADGTWARLRHGDDYTNTANDFTLNAAPPAGTVLEVVYASGTVDLAPADDNDLDNRPAAVRGRSIDVYVSDGAATPTLVRWRGLQSAEVNWRVTPEVTNELGNPYAVERDFDQPEVSGSFTMRPASIDYLFERVAQIANVPTNQVVGALSSQELELHIGINHPDTGVRLKTFVVEDARIVPPAVPAQVNQRTEVTWTWGSDSGDLAIFKGEAA